MSLSYGTKSIVNSTQKHSFNWQNIKKKSTKPRLKKKKIQVLNMIKRLPIYINSKTRNWVAMF